MIFQKTKGIHIDGRKSMSKRAPLEVYTDPEFVYIHLQQQSMPMTRLVNIGDQVNMGQIVARLENACELNVHASVSGEVTAIKKVWHSSGKMVDAIEIKNDFKNTLDQSLKAHKNAEGLSRDDLVELMLASGLRGLGGACFPTHIKYRSKRPLDTVIINAVECEPYLTSDYSFIIHHPEKLVKGLTYMMKTAGASKGVIAIKNYNQDLKKAILPHLEGHQNIFFYETEDVYPAGWEKYIVERITGKTYQNLPSEVGVIVNNSATAITFADVVDLGLPLVKRPVTITGEGIKEPKNFLVPIGTKVSELVAKCGGYTEDIDPKKSYYIAGGPMTGTAILIDDLIVNDAVGAVIVKPTVDKIHPECLGCGQCADVCPVYLTPTEIKRALEFKNTDLLKQLGADKCIQCGLCSYICPSHVEITDAVVKAKALLKKGEKEDEICRR